MAQLAHWRDFVRFINDAAFWSKWETMLPLTKEGDYNEEQYFIDACKHVKEGRQFQSFDFSKTNVTLTLRDPSETDWENDGEKILHFFMKWLNGEKI